jgi:hypothetical protein
MNKRERIEAALALREPDRTPILGGWIASPDHMMDLAGVSAEEYWAEPVDVSIRAYEALGSDGLVDVFVPKHRDDFRCVDHDTYKSAEGTMTLEETVEHIEGLPSAEQVEREFDFEGEYADFKSGLESRQAQCGDMVWMPAQWGAGASISWYQVYGYENFFALVGLYPELTKKLLEIGGARGYCRSRLIARAHQEGLYPGAVFLGEDICTQRGPMISPDFIEKYYIPQLRHGLAPLLEVGCRPVWHCDGDVRLLLEMLIDAGVQGFQGFQPECEMLLEDIVKLRTARGEKLLILGPLAVTTELPVCTAAEIERKVHEAIDTCAGNASLLLFTSNTINPDVPLDNIVAMHRAAKR